MAGGHLSCSCQVWSAGELTRGRRCSWSAQGTELLGPCSLHLGPKGSGHRTGSFQALLQPRARLAGLQCRAKAPRLQGGPAGPGRSSAGGQDAPRPATVIPPSQGPEDVRGNGCPWPGAWRGGPVESPLFKAGARGGPGASRKSLETPSVPLHIGPEGSEAWPAERAAPQDEGTADYAAGPAAVQAARYWGEGGREGAAELECEARGRCRGCPGLPRSPTSQPSPNLPLQNAGFGGPCPLPACFLFCKVDRPS